jgi:hypothetical protein
MMRFLIAAVVLLSLGGCSHPTAEDMKSLRCGDNQTRGMTIEEVRARCGKPSTQILIELKEGGVLFFVSYLIDKSPWHYILRFDGSYVRPKILHTELKEVVPETREYLDKVKEIVDKNHAPGGWQYSSPRFIFW